MPYRSTRLEAPKATPEAGIVDDMVRQFADPYAFLRELVQNGIDAGAKTLIVRVERDIDGALRTSVEDDGKGMSRAVIDGPLLTLFESSKESDETKIGKYGVGFVSVFALDPTRVEVRTRTGEEAWLLRLFRDYTFELERDADPPEGTGTIVSLIHEGDPGVHAKNSEEALRRWCRHARVPITLSAIDAMAPSDVKPTSINEPFDLDADVVVRYEKDGLAILAGASASNTSFAGFYNRGLTLYETTQPEPDLHGIRFKIESPKLAHTLSRDNIRRDEELDNAVDVVRRLVNGALWNAIAERAAEAAAASDPARLAVLYAAACARGFGRSDLRALHAPLTDAVDGVGSMPLATIGSKAGGRVLLADTPTPLTRALARRGEPVVRHLALAPFLGGGRAGCDVRLVDEAFSFAEAIDPGEDAPLLEALRSLLGVVGRSVERVCLANFSGARSSGLARVVDTRSETAVTKPGTPPDWSRSAVLFLDAEDALVRIARKRARTDVAIAAHVLCRAVLLHEGPIAAKDVDRLLEGA